MPFREPTLPLQDSIRMIEAFTSGIDLEVFRKDPKTIAAVERKLLLISEAAMRLASRGQCYVQACRGETFVAWAISFVISMTMLISRRFGIQ